MIEKMLIFEETGRMSWEELFRIRNIPLKQ